MILYSLKCARDHVFDEWFDNSGAYEEKAQAGEIACPECGDHNVTKAIMAPRIGAAAKEQAPVCGMGSPMGGGCGGCPMAAE